MVFSVSENKPFIPNDKQDHQERREKVEREFWEPLPDVSPAVLRIIILEVNKQANKSKPDDIVLSDEEAQDPENSGEPEPLVQRGP